MTSNGNFITKLSKTRATNSTQTVYPSFPPSLTAPSGDGIVDVPVYGSYSAGKKAQVVFFGVGADDATANYIVLGWQPSANNLWIPTLLAGGVATLSAYQGISGGDVTNSERFVDIITNVVGASGTDYTILNGSDTPASLLLESRGFAKIQIEFEKDATTSMNALIGFL